MLENKYLDGTWKCTWSTKYFSAKYKYDKYEYK